jgi:hypothetical protein
METVSEDNLSPTAAGNTKLNTKAAIVALPAPLPLLDDFVDGECVPPDSAGGAADDGADGLAEVGF